ncbi:MAG: alpha-mannosidase [Actinomycetota bacterium]
MSESSTIHLVPHTHWDREWYRPFQDFRLRLVDVIDDLLELMEQEPDLAFTLDGQLATVDDYLEVRPEAEDRLRALIAADRLAVGPWMFLMDEFLVSGETIVRNLEAGLRRGRELGSVMTVGYLPDMFGHVAQMPQILARFGIERAVVWRGVPAAVDRHVFSWEALDGSAVGAEYLVDGYGNAAHLFAVPAGLDDKVAGFRRALEHFFGDDDLLAMHGTDHTAPLPDLVDLVRSFNDRGHHGRLRISTLADYLASSRAPGPGDPHWRGEMRSGARANMLMGVTSTRVPLRARAATAERLLARYAEPVVALHGSDDGARLLDMAWRRVIENSAHDSICGCSTDEVDAQVMVRYDEAKQIAHGLVRRVAEGMATNAVGDGIVAFNPSPTNRSDLVPIDLPIPEHWDEVALEMPDGRWAPTQEVRRDAPLIHRARVPGHAVPSILDIAHGRELFGREINGFHTGEADGIPRLTIEVDRVADPPSLDMDALRAQIETAAAARPHDEWDVLMVGRPRRSLLAQLEAPALGWTSGRMSRGSGEVGAPVVANQNSLENTLVRVEVDERGELDLEGGGASLRGVGRLADGGDAGDSYNYAPPAADEQISDPRAVEIRCIARGPLCAELEIARSYEWPESSGAIGRSDRRVRVTVTTSVELRAGEPFARVRVRFENPCRDHRLRWHIPLMAPVGSSWAEGQFAVVERGLEVEGGHGEHPLPTFPAHGMVSVDGISVLLDRVTEYEVVDGGRELALTLLRATGMISCNFNALRREPAGPEVAIPGAQCIGPVEQSFALFPHAAPWQEAGALEQRERFAHPFVVMTGRGDSEGRPGARNGLQIEGRNVVLTSLRRRRDALEVRLVCQQSEPTTAVISGDISAAVATDLLGGEPSPLTVAGGRVEAPLQPWEILTLQIRR